MRPEAEQRLRAGFQRRVDKQSERYAPELAHAAQLAAGSGCGQLAGVFSRQAPFRARGIRRQTWFFAFTGGFMLIDDPLGAGVAVRWDEVVDASPVWTPQHDPVAEEPRTVLGGYRLRTADGRTHDISRDFKNVQDPYQEMGQLFRHLAPGTIGTTMPTFPTVDQIISAYAR
jgi:hypothetical protein